MNKFINRFFLVSFLLSCVFQTSTSFAQTSQSESKMAETVLITDSWARATFALAKTGAAYMTLKNMDERSIQLVSISVDESVASIAEIHHTKMSDGMMQMQELADGVEIAGGKTVAFAPGGKHIMLMGLTGPLEAGKQILITLTFSDGSEKAQYFPIKDARKIKL